MSIIKIIRYNLDHYNEFIYYYGGNKIIDIEEKHTQNFSEFQIYTCYGGLTKIEHNAYGPSNRLTVRFRDPTLPIGSSRIALRQSPPLHGTLLRLTFSELMWISCSSYDIGCILELKRGWVYICNFRMF